MTSYGWRLPQLPEDERHLEYLAQGEFRLQRCLRCQAFRHPARWICPHCRSDRYEWSSPSGAGTVTALSWYFEDMLTRQGAAPPPQLPYCAAVIRLDEGPFMMGRVQDAAFGSVRVGDRVEARVGRALVSDGARIVFSLVS